MRILDGIAEIARHHRSYDRQQSILDPAHEQALLRTILLLFNLLAEFQRAAGLSGYHQPATLRALVLTCGAILGRAGRRIVLHLLKAGWSGTPHRLAGQHFELANHNFAEVGT